MLSFIFFSWYITALKINKLYTVPITTNKNITFNNNQFPEIPKRTLLKNRIQ